MTFKSLKTTTLALIASALLAITGVSMLNAKTTSEQIDLTYVWTAQPGMEQKLVGTYEAVGQVLNENEPGLLFYEIAVSEKGDQIVIHEVFENAEALAIHLNHTAAKFFPQLVEFATPGPFIFRGNVPQELKAAAYQMNMGAIFTTDWTGFKR